MDDKLFYLVCYAVAVCLITVYAYYKKNNLIYRAMWTIYAVSAVFSVLCKIFQGTLVGFGTYHNSWYDLSDTTWWGYALIIICNIIAFKPIKIFNMHNEIDALGKNRRMQNFFVMYAYLYIILAILYILPSINIIRGVFGVSDFGLLRNSLYGNSENEGSAVLANNFISNFSLKLCLQFKLMSIVVAFSMIKEKIKVHLAAILLVITFFLYFVDCMATAARGGLLIFVFCAGLVGLMFYPYLSKANKRKVFMASMVLLGVVFSFFMAVTISRLASDTGGGNLLLRNVSFYLGHAPIEFSKVTGSLDHFAWGKTILGRLANHYFGAPYSWEAIASDIGYPNIGALFVTYLGFIYTDFGVFGCLSFTTIWMLFMYDILKKRPNKISTLYFFLYYLNFYVMGNFVVGRLEYAAVITTFILYFVIRIIERTPALRRFFTLRIKTTRSNSNVRHCYTSKNSTIQSEVEKNI